MTGRVASITLAVSILASYASAQQTSLHFKSTPYCGYEFDYPAGWSAEARAPDKYTTCAVEIRPLDFKKRMDEDDVDVYTLTVSVPAGGTFLDAASRGGFDFYKGKWVTRGRQGIRGTASVIETPEWSGIRGTAEVGCHHAHGGYAGLCEFERLVMRDSGEGIWVMEGGSQTSQVFEKIFATFRFAH